MPNYVYDELMKKKKAAAQPVQPKAPAPLPVTKQEILDKGPLAIQKAMQPIIDFNENKNKAPAPLPTQKETVTTPPGTNGQSNMDTGDFTSEEDQAKALIQEGRDAQIAKEKELFGESYTPATQKDEIDLFLNSQKEEKTQLQTQIENMNKVDQSEFNISKNDAFAAADGVAAQFSQNREGVTSAGNAMISKQFNKRTEERVSNAETNLNMRFDQRAQLIKQLDEAQKNGKSELAGKINEQIASAENQIRQEKIKLAEYAQQSRTDAFAFMEKAPAGSLAGMDPAMVAQNFGVDAMTASVMVNMDTKKLALEAKQDQMDAVDFASKMADLEIKMENAKNAGMTEDMKNFEQYKNMIDYDPAGAEEFALFTGIKEKSFFSDFQEDWTQQTTQRETVYKQTGVKAPIKSKYAYDLTPDGGISLEKSAPAGKRLVTRGQCGEFVNDVINGGPGLMGDSFASKKAKVNSALPVPGSAFVENISGNTGHTGIVEKVYDDQSFDIRESNYVAGYTISTAHIKPGDARWKTIVEQGGFYVPGASQAKDVMTNVPQGYDQAQGSGNPVMDYAQQYASGELSVGDMKDMGMSKGDIAMVTKAAFKLPKSSMDQETLNNYAQQVANGKMSITDLKNLGLKENQLQQISLASSSMSGGESNSARTTAEIILGSGGKMSLKDIPEKDRSAVQAQINLLKNDPSYKQSGGSAAMKAAQAIFKGGNTLSLSQIPQDMRVDVETELGKMREQALKSGDVYGAMRASAGGRAMSETSMQKFEKTANVIDQLQGLTSVLGDKKSLKAAGVDSSPFWGWIQGKNPWSEDGQEISAQLQAIVPNLARGVYGEVGVLTDRDVELYRKTLPNLKQPEAIQKSITALTLRSLRNSMENQIKVQTANGVDMSGSLAYYSQIDETVKQMESELGIKDPKATSKSPLTAGGALSGLSAVTAPFLGNKIYQAPAQPTQEVSPWDDIEMDDPNDFLANF